MKSFITVILAILLYMASGISCIWVLVEFIIYLVKDHPFNAWSIWSAVITLVLAIIMHGLSAILQHKTEKINPDSTSVNSKYKSKWQQQMDEIQTNRNKNNHG